MSKNPNIVKRWVRRHGLSLSLISLIFIFFVALFADRIFISIPAGHAGVIWKRFGGGTDTETIYPEGFHVILPWNRMALYNLRLKEATDTVKALTKNGLKLKIEIVIRYRLDQSNLGILHKNLGEDFLKILILPEINSQARTVISNFLPAEIYTDKRAEIQEAIQEGTRKELLVKFRHRQGNTAMVYVEDVLLKGITLPETVRKAIEAKVEQKHLMLQYQYILQREEKERQRKEIEAMGIQKFQEIVQNGISDRYLRWKGIDATLALAKSDNAKVVIIGAGDEGMPLILGNMGANPSAAMTLNNDAKKVELLPAAPPVSSATAPVTELPKPLTTRIMDAVMPNTADVEPSTPADAKQGSGKTQ